MEKLTRNEQLILTYMKKNATVCIPLIRKGAESLGVSKAYYHRVSQSLCEKGYLDRDGSRYIIPQE